MATTREQVPMSTLLAGLGRDATARVRRALRPLGLGAQQFLVLQQLQALGPTSQAELADALGIEIKDLVRHQDELAQASVGSLNALVNGEEDMATERIDTLISEDTDADPEQFAVTGEAKERFREAFECLAPRERKIAVLLYVYNLTLREIGEILGVTESRVCQIHGQITKKLRVEIEADEQLFSEVA